RAVRAPSTPSAAIGAPGSGNRSRATRAAARGLLSPRQGSTMKRSPGVDARGTLLLATWLGLATAYLELIVVGWRKFGEGWSVGMGVDVVWMAPIVQIAVFGAAGLLIVLVGRARPRLVTAGR